MGLKCSKCKKDIPLYRMVLKSISCGNCGARYRAGNAFSARMGISGIALGGLGITSDVGFIISIVIVVSILSYFKFSNILNNHVERVQD